MKLPALFRERPLTAGLAVAAALCLMTVGGLGIYLGRVKMEAARQEARLEKILAASRELMDLKGPASAETPRLRPGAELSPAAVDAIAQETGVAGNVGAVNVNRARRDDQTTEQVINLNLNAVTREQLARFLWAVEKIDPAVRTRELRVSATKQPSLVDAKVQIAAYESVATPTR